MLSGLTEAGKRETAFRGLGPSESAHRPNSGNSRNPRLRRLWPFLARLKGIPAARPPQKSRGTERANRMGPLFSLLTERNDERRPRGADLALALT